MTDTGKWIFKGADVMDEKLVNGITDMVERACNMSEIDAIYRHLEHLLYEASGMADDYPESYGGTD
jgi:hypothetical protein